MGNSTYTLRYLPHFEEDLNKIVDYITFKLHNTMAAIEYVSMVEKAINNRLNSPLSFEPYPSNRRRKHTYYRIYIKNYIIFYVVIGQVMEVRRLIYSKRDMKQQIE
ncbi:MAG: type II toxin-antitoxin system RelE/ParE family toxin [Vallitaleaceae bacterium]|nr:type II toxin-antitoxin system RelE/ParE family toxin [Vallitaleaceae bacterium]